MERIKVEPYSIIHEVIRVLEVKAYEKGIELVFKAEGPLPEMIETDPVRLRQIVFNLIDVEQMRKTPDDRREDFDDVYDFDEAFQYSFQFSSADSSEEPRL